MITATDESLLTVLRQALFGKEVEKFMRPEERNFRSMIARALAPFISEQVRRAAAEAWDEGLAHARVEVGGVQPGGFSDNPYRAPFILQPEEESEKHHLVFIHRNAWPWLDIDTVPCSCAIGHDHEEDADV